MGDQMRRLSGVAGIAWVVLAFASRLVRGSVPDPSSKHATQKMADFYATKAHQSHALTGAVLGLLGLFFFAWFIGGVVDRLRDAQGSPGAAVILVVRARAARLL